jgi:hypothetical protein
LDSALELVERSRFVFQAGCYGCQLDLEITRRLDQIVQPVLKVRQGVIDTHQLTHFRRRFHELCRSPLVSKGREHHPKASNEVFPIAQAGGALG